VSIIHSARSIDTKSQETKTTQQCGDELENQLLEDLNVGNADTWITNKRFWNNCNRYSVQG